jgi:hypothetical protein
MLPDDGRPPAPPYRDEGPHAMWHFSEDPGIERFVPRRVQAGPSSELEPRVWAVDTRHAPMCWFPRDCPRGCAWWSERTRPEDRDRFFRHTEATRIHVIEQAWLEAVRRCALFAYRLPTESFRPEEVGGYWSTVETVEPLERVEVGDLLQRHADAGIEVRITPSIWTWWTDLVPTTLEFSGSRLRNCGRPVPAALAQL